MSHDPEDLQLSTAGPGPLELPSVDAVIRDGVLVPLVPLNLPDGTPVRAYLTLRIDHSDTTQAPLPAAPPILTSTFNYIQQARQTVDRAWSRVDRLAQQFRH